MVRQQKLILNLSFGGHSTADDVAQIKRAVSKVKPDIYAPEAFGNSYKNRETRAKTDSAFFYALKDGSKSKGNEELGKIKAAFLSAGACDEFSSAQKPMIEKFHLRTLPIEAADGGGSWNISYRDKWDTSLRKIYWDANRGNEDDVLEMLRQKFISGATANQAREAQYCYNLLTYREDAAHFYPELQDKKKIVAVAAMGSKHHYTLLPKLRKLANEISWLSVTSWKNSKHFRSELSSKIMSLAEKGDELVSGKGKELLEKYFRYFIASH